MYQQRWIYLTIAAVIGTLILLLAYQTLTQAVFPWNLLALVAAVSLACLALMVLGKTAFTPHNLKNGRSIANHVAAGIVISYWGIWHTLWANRLTNDPENFKYRMLGE